MADEIGFDINDALSTRFGNTLAAEFVSGNKFATFPYRPVIATSRDEPSEYAGIDEVKLHFIEQEFVFQDPILRYMIGEANSTFVALQKFKENGSNQTSVYTQISQTYRCIIRACNDKLTKNETKSDTNQYITIFYSIEFLWHLCEILYLQPNSSSSSIVANLLEWVRFHFPNTERKYAELYEMGNDAANQVEYWPTLKGLILQGQVQSVVSLLHLHPKAATPSFKMVETVLNEMPLYKSHLTLTSFNQRLNYWRKETESKLEAHIFANEPDLEEIIKLVLVDSDAWNEHLKNSTTWYALLPGYLYFTAPFCEHSQLGDYAKKWLARWARLKGVTGSSMRANQLETIIFNLMDDDLHKAIHSMHLVADNKWFIIHLIDLLYHSGRLINVKDAAKLREQLLYDFGALLMTRSSLWQLGIDYLQYSSPEGMAAIELLLTKIPLRNERLALQILSVCHQFGFTSAERDICIVLGRKSFNQKRYGNALEWALRSKDSIFVTGIADFILKHYSMTGEILCPEVIANVGPKMFLSPRLVFLAKYLDFFELYRKKEFSYATDVILDLIRSNLSPEYFWPTLLIDTIPLLESLDPKFTSVETTLILQHLEFNFIPMVERKKKNLLKNPNEPIAIIKDYRLENIEEFIQLLRLACARHVSRALILENQILDR